MKATSNAIIKSLSPGKNRQSLWLIASGLIIIGTWSNLIGYGAAFLIPDSTIAQGNVIRDAYYAGRALEGIAFVFCYRFFDKNIQLLSIVIPFLVCICTIILGFAAYQTLVPTIVLSIPSSLILGFCYMWFVITFYALLARTCPTKPAIVIIVLVQVAEQLITVLLGYGIDQTLQIFLCTIMPLLAGLTLYQANKRASVLAKQKPLAGSAKNHFLLLIVAGGVALTAIAAISDVGFWGKTRDLLNSGNTFSSFSTTAIACVIVLLLAYTTLIRYTDSPLSYRYQVPFIVFIATLMLSLMQPIFSEQAINAIGVLFMAVEYYGHAFVWTITIAAIKELDLSPYFISGLASIVSGLLSLVWFFLYGNNFEEVRLWVLFISFCLILIAAVHPRILYSQSVSKLGDLEELNEYTLEGEPKIPLGSNGLTLTEHLKERSSFLARQYRLSERESEVLYYLIQGHTRSWIQKELVLSEGTVRTHISHVYSKMGLHSNEELLDLVYFNREPESTSM